jgi:hypothetical protein
LISHDSFGPRPQSCLFAIANDPLEKKHEA